MSLEVLTVILRIIVALVGVTTLGVILINKRDSNLKMELLMNNHLAHISTGIEEIKADIKVISKKQIEHGERIATIEGVGKAVQKWKSM